MKRFLIIVLLMTGFCAGAQQAGTRIQYLSGTGSDDTVSWDFFCTAGRGSGTWTTIPVPSCWECQGFGEYHYGHDDEEKRIGESGIYRHTFLVPSDWKGSDVRIVFCGVMTDTEVSVNGRSAGKKHLGGYCEFSYDITSLLHFGKKNTLEVKVDKESSNASVQDAERRCDFWIYGGIYRPVYIEARPAAHIEDIAIDARADGSINVKAVLAGRLRNAAVKAVITDKNGVEAGETLCVEGCGPGECVLSGKVVQPALWSAEFPDLYDLTVTLEQDGKVLHRTKERFGFRTIELRPHDGVYVNGVKIMFKGVNRHSHWPTTGRTLNHDINLQDAQLIKEMNMNAVRMSHYPPEKDFLDICDSLGLYVLDELTGWQSCYDTESGSELVRELVSRDKNHPCVLMWDNGNEGGFNFDLVPLYSEYDIQKRPVIHPWQTEDGWNTFHYPTWDNAFRILTQERNVYFPTELLHGLYDGGHGAGLEDYWNLMCSSPYGAGGFLWDLVDQGLVRDDMDGFIDTAGDYGADGILGPYREKEGSFFTIKDIWSPVQIEGGKYLPSGWDGRLTVSNNYSFTNLCQCRFEAEFSRVDFISGDTATVKVDPHSPDVAPGMRGVLEIGCPADIGKYDFLTVKAFDPYGRELYAWSKRICTAAGMASRIVSGADTGCRLLKDADGLVSGLENGGRVLAFGKGPRPVSGNGDDNKVEFSMTGSGWLEVSYTFSGTGEFDNIGVTFDFPEEKVRGVRWLGDGPYRVWKNRLRGVEPGLWSKDFNDTRTGQSFDYPEFKGYHSGLYAADIITDTGTLRIVSDTEDLFLCLFTPGGQGNDNVAGHFPDGDISVLSAISPVGCKFFPSTLMGPSGQANMIAPEHGPLAAVKGHFYMTFLPD